jgi:signal transduction histidine kinase
MRILIGRRIVSQLPIMAAVLLAGVIGIMAILSLEYRQEVGAVQHTLEVEKKLSQLLSTIQEAETSNRGFLLSGDESYLQGYDSATGQLGNQFGEVKKLVADNAEQVRILSDLWPIIEGRLALLKTGIAIRRAEGLEAGARFVQTNVGRNVMLEVRSGLSQLQANEVELLRSRQASAERLITVASITSIVGIILVILSVSAWLWSVRRDERLLQAAMAERAHAEQQMRQMQKIEALGQLTGGIAHDFNNMLAVVISGLGLIKRRLAAGNTDVLELADATIDGANRAAALTTRLMAFARQQPLAPQSLDANALINGMGDLIDRSIGEIIALKIIQENELWTIYADPSQLENALLNLCVNARDAMPKGGKLTIETSNRTIDEHLDRQTDMPIGKHICIRVSDTGSGMAPDVVARAFDPFFTTKDVDKGTGLGLSQVHGFVKQSNGHIKIYSEPGHGTTINIYLPRHEQARAIKPEAAAAALAEQVENSGQLILVVEDDERVREITVAMLLELGHDVIDADGAAAALRQLEAHPDIALLFTDVVMPITNGRQLADQALKRWPDLKILFTTGFTRDVNLQSGAPDEEVNLITKPFSLDQLAAKVTAILGGDGARRGLLQ